MHIYKKDTGPSVDCTGREERGGGWRGKGLQEQQDGECSAEENKVLLSLS